MVYILPQQESLGGMLGKSLGEGLSQGLKNLAALRLEEMQRQRNAKGLQALMYSPEDAQALSGLDQNLLQTVLKERLRQSTYNQAGQNELGTLMALLGGQQGQQQGQSYGSQSGGALDQLLGRMPEGGSIRPGQAVPIANFLESQRQHQQNFGQKQRAFEVGTVQPKFNELQNQYADLNNQLQTYQQLGDLNKSGRQLTSGIFGFGKPEESQLFESLLESLTPTGATEAQLESSRRKLPTLKQSPNVRQQLIDLNIKRINSELARVQKQAQGLNYGDLNQFGSDQEATSPGSKQVYNQALDQAQGSPIQKLQQAQDPLAKMQVAQQNEQAQQGQGNNFGDLANSAAYLGSRGLKGAGEGITSLVGLPFNLANFLSMGKIPVPESIKTIQNLPEQTVDSIFGKLQPGSEGEKWLGNFVEDIASFLTPGGLLGKVGKLSRLQQLEKVGKLLSTSPKAAATVSGIGNLAKLATEKVGGTETEGNIAKAGAMLLTPIVGSRLASRQVDKFAQEAAAAIKPGEVVTSPNLLKANMEFYKDLTKNVQTPLKKEIIDDVLPLFHQTAPAEMKLNEVLKVKQSLTKAARDPEFARSMRNSLPTYMKELDKTLEQVKNPDFAQPFSEMKDLGDALKTTNVVSDFAKKHLRSRYNSPLTYGIVGLAITQATGLPLFKSIGAVGLPALTLAEGQRVLKIAAKSPAFRKYYGDYIKAAAMGSVKQAQDAARNLDKIIVHEEKRLE
ncbi:MAG TPA: hypothetical protein VKR53_01565 [Puia sp.]|nr:hypothetical protein [Puia sp.]